MGCVVRGKSDVERFCETAFSVLCKLLPSHRINICVPVSSGVSFSLDASPLLRFYSRDPFVKVPRQRLSVPLILQHVCRRHPEWPRPHEGARPVRRASANLFLRAHSTFSRTSRPPPRHPLRPRALTRAPPHPHPHPRSNGRRSAPTAASRASARSSTRSTASPAVRARRCPRGRARVRALAP